MLTYTIDFGNTFTKIAIFNNSTLLEIVKLETKSFDFKFQNDSLILYSNVSKDFKNLLPNDAIDASALIKNFKTTYDESKLGADRKVISYYLQRQGIKNALLVDAGSFITFDIIENNIHLGGPIYLGLGNYLKSYPHFSEHLPLIDAHDSHQEVNNTKAAIQKAFDAYLKMINSEVTRINTDRIIITGGDANLLSPTGENLDQQIIHEALFSLRDLI